MKQCWPAPERNKGPLADVLDRVQKPGDQWLELSSGSGQHAVHFAERFPQVTILPSDIEPDHLRSIEAWVEHAGLANLHSPIALDVRSPVWPVNRVDLVFNANMIHIAPWECCLGLLDGASRHLVSGGHLVLYGPFRIDGAHTAESNAAFDQSLRERDPAWGVRDLETVVSEAQARSLCFVERVAMPANNQTLIFQRAARD